MLHLRSCLLLGGRTLSVQYAPPLSHCSITLVASDLIVTQTNPVFCAASLNRSSNSSLGKCGKTKGDEEVFVLLLSDSSDKELDDKEVSVNDMMSY